MEDNSSDDLPQKSTYRGYLDEGDTHLPEIPSMSAAEGNGQKSMPPRRRGSVQQGRSFCLLRPEGRVVCDARSVLPVREHGKRATCLHEAFRRRQGTPLATFFNIPLVHGWSQPASSQAVMGHDLNHIAIVDFGRFTGNALVDRHHDFFLF